MALNYRGSIDSSEPMLQPVSIVTTVTVAVGDVVKSYDIGRATNGAAAHPILGVVHAIVKGKPLLPVKSTEVVPGTANQLGTQTVTTTASDVYYALVDINPHSVYSAAVSGTLGTTVSSTLRGCRLDVNSAGAAYGQLLESTATRTVATCANFYSHGLDPQDSTRLMVSIAASELFSVNA